MWLLEPYILNLERAESGLAYFPCLLDGYKIKPRMWGWCLTKWKLLHSGILGIEAGLPPPHRGAGWPGLKIRTSP